MTSSTRDGWERLVAAVLKREQFRQLCRQDSISTVSSEGFSERTLSFSSSRLSSRSVPPSPLIPLRNPNLYQGGNTASGPAKWKLFPAWFKKTNIEEKYLVDISEHLRIHLGLLRRFSLQELQVATKNFTNRIGYGSGYFYTIYKGQLADGSNVAVERHLARGDKTAAQQVLEIVEIDSFAAHANVLNVLGFCITPKEWLLVYPLMVNGSVALHLGGMLGTREPRLPINWPTRKGIALGAANGLAHLHEECLKKILHLDIHAANILLNENFEAVVGDFGLGILLAEHDACAIQDTVRGTSCYIDPDYLSTGKVSEKTDVFGYGVFLLQLITGQFSDLYRLANDEEVMLLDWVKGNLEEKKWRNMIGADCGDYIDEEVEHMLQIALVCTHSDPDERPKMSDIVRALEVDVFAEKLEEWSYEAEMYMDAASKSC